MYELAFPITNTKSICTKIIFNDNSISLYPSKIDIGSNSIYRNGRNLLISSINRGKNHIGTNIPDSRLKIASSKLERKKEFLNQTALIPIIKLYKKNNMNAKKKEIKKRNTVMAVTSIHRPYTITENKNGKTAKYTIFRILPINVVQNS